ncbi:transforming growth factor-beta-induced protein ig-h3-like [Ptychodera flava]|uniref:transforming growth factor-beta-induced protein ig-h3-like n=1 Tax=Ptychodera flava TaxID=63121 RepID=UPI003969E999
MFFEDTWPRFRPSRPWWQGPNVCISRVGNITSDFENMFQDEDDFFNSYPSFYGPAPSMPQQRMRGRRSSGPFSRYWSTYCHDHEGHYRRCSSRLTSSGTLRTSEVTHECCHGYGREEGKPGCPVELDVKPLTKTLKAVGAGDFIDLIKDTKLRKTLKGEDNYTIFAPLKVPSVDNEVNLIETLVINDAVNGPQTIAGNHIVAGVLRTSDMKDEEIITTVTEQKIRLGYYPNSGSELLVTVNCVPVVEPNVFATNGVVHVIDEVIEPPTQSILEIIETDPRFSILRTAVADTGMSSQLSERSQLTFFAPTDEAFKKLPPSLLNDLIKDMSCLKAVVENHIVTHTICSAAITGNHYIYTLLKTHLDVNRTDDDKLYIMDAEFVSKDMMATNGVIHVIDTVLVPTEALQLPLLVQGTLLDLIQQADLLYLLENTKNVTLFAPTEEAIQNLPQDVKDSLRDSITLRKVLTHHVVPEYLTASDLGRRVDDGIIALDGDDLHIDVCGASHSARPRGLTVECVPVVDADIRGCNGVVHKINKVLIPPSGNILEIIKADSNYSSLLKAIEISGLASTLDGDGAVTLFAPNNEAFDKLPDEYLIRVFNDPSTLKNVISHHVVEGVQCGAKLMRGTWWYPLYLTTLAEDNVRVWEGSGGLMADSALIGKTDTMATNGVIHHVDKILIPY